MDASIADLVQETCDRTRRMETRLTEHIKSLHAQPFWDAKRCVVMASKETTLNAIVRAVPDDWPAESPVLVFSRATNEPLCSINRRGL